MDNILADVHHYNNYRYFVQFSNFLAVSTKFTLTPEALTIQLTS